MKVEHLAIPDVILVTPSARAHLVTYQPQMPLISVTFRVDERSIQLLAERLQARVHRGVPLAV